MEQDPAHSQSCMESKSLRHIGIEIRITATRGWEWRFGGLGNRNMLVKGYKVALRGTNLNVLINIVNVIDDNVSITINE